MVVSWEWYRRRLMPEASRGGLSEKCDEMHESRKSWHDWLREHKAAGKEEDSDEHGPLLVPMSAGLVSGQRHHRMPRWKVGQFAPEAKSCELIRSVTGSPGKFVRSTRFLWSNTSKSTTYWPRAPTILLVRSSASQWFTASYFSDGS